MIVKLRKKPVVIEGIQLTEHNIKDVYEFIHGTVQLTCRMAEDRWEDYEMSVIKDGLKLKTLESDGQTQVASIGDWVLKGVKGEFYPCKPDIKELTYEEVSTPENIKQPILPMLELSDGIALLPDSDQ